MRQISVSQFTTYRWNFKEDLLRYQALGYDSIGIWRRKLEDFGQRDAIDLVYETKMNVSSLSWAGGFTGSDGRSHVDAIEDACEAIALASQLNAGCLVVHPGNRNNHTNSHAFRLLHSALSTLVPVAEDYGVTLALELIPGFTQSPWTFVHSFSQMDQLLDLFPPEQLGLVLDLYHVGLNQPAFDRLDSLIDRVSLVQLSDRSLATTIDENRQALGSGDVDVPQWLSALDRLGYRGPLELELHGLGTEGIDYFNLLDQTHDYLAATVPANRQTELSNASATQIKSAD